VSEGGQFLLSLDICSAITRPKVLLGPAISYLCDLIPAYFRARLLLKGLPPYLIKLTRPLRRAIIYRQDDPLGAVHASFGRTEEDALT
jgi:hypothetical protein